MFFKLLKLIPYLIIAFLILRVTHLNKQNEDLRGKTAELSEQLKSQTIITKEKIVYKYRDSEGKPKEQSIYIPSEGSVNIITPKDNENVKPSTLDNFFNTIIDQNDGSVIMIQNKGFCLAPEIAAIYSKELEVAIQVRLLYWNRYNAGIGFGHKDTLFIYGSRIISDILPFTRNASLEVGVGKNLKDQDTRFLVGIGVRL